MSDDDVRALELLKAQYFRYLDTKDWARWRHLFTDDLVFYQEDGALPTDCDPVTVGRDAFIDYVSARLATSVTVHHGHMPELEVVDPDHARGIWAMYDWVDDPVRNYAIKGYGHYREEYERGEDGRWRIKVLRLNRLRVDRIPPSHPESAPT